MTSPLPGTTVAAVGRGTPNNNGVIIPTQVKAGGNSIKVGEDICVFESTCITRQIDKMAWR